MFKRFLSDRSGNFAIAMSVLSIPILLSVGFGVDYSRLLAAHTRLQGIADTTALALAASGEKDEAKLEQMAEDFISGNMDAPQFKEITIASLDTGDNAIDIDLSSQIDTYFMGLANYRTLDVDASALAERAVTGSVEVALVLDNTYSMAETDSKGVTKLAALKTAANSLITTLMSNPDADVKIGLVPYADYVNVGTGYRNKSWLSVPADYTVAAVPESGCRMETVTVQGACTAYGPQYDCSTYVDGVRKPKTCKDCTARKPDTTKEQKKCDVNAKAAVNYKWYGCIGSRKTGTYRLDDTVPTVTYPGYVDTSQKCLNPIVTLSDDEKALKTAITGMVYNLGSYEPYTYIPAGLIWGVNVLSPTEPLNEAYDVENKEPRKALLLMTDGENTRRFQASDGKHVAFDSNATKAADQLKVVNSETLSICTYAKSKKIEVYSVAFMVDDAAAKTMLQSCATDSDHYFDASDPDKLVAAFTGIAQSLSQVRLAR